MVMGIVQIDLRLISPGPQFVATFGRDGSIWVELLIGSTRGAAAGTDRFER